VLARVVRYLACFPLWEAEAYAAATLVDRGFGDLARPLDYQTVCPLGFLWVEWLAVRLLGCSEYALRLFPLVCGIAGLLLFAWVSGRLLASPARLLSIGLLAVAYPAIRNSAECRQYASDLFFAIALIALCAGYLTGQPGRRTRWWLGLAAALPVALLFSFPSVFVAAGVILALGWSGARQQTPDSGEARIRPRLSLAARLAPSAALAVLLVASFAVLGLVYLRPLYRAAGGPPAPLT
ncbi:MAG: glycosyltransferase family 39 protein, partial [Thermoanaerobaculia bacterium]